jgi:hypothetical protein
VKQRAAKQPLIKLLFYKELKLLFPPVFYLFPLFSALMLAPGYPASIGVSYAILAVFNIFNICRINKDLEFSAMLPITRSRTVLAKHFLVIFIEALHLIAAVPFAVISAQLLYPSGSQPGMPPNPAYFGFMLTAFAAFNLIFLPLFFRTGSKTGIPMLLAFPGYTAILTAAETTAFLFPVLSGAKTAAALSPALSGASSAASPAALLFQLLILGAGLLLFAGSALLSFRLSVRNFAKVNL